MYKITSYHCIALKQGLVNKEKEIIFDLVLTSITKKSYLKSLLDTINEQVCWRSKTGRKQVL